MLAQTGAVRLEDAEQTDSIATAEGSGSGVRRVQAH